MAETVYNLDPEDASMAVTLLRSVARLIDTTGPFQLTEVQRSLLNYPAAQPLVDRDPEGFVARIRALAQAIADQLPPEAPKPAPEQPMPWELK